MALSLARWPKLWQVSASWLNTHTLWLRRQVHLAKWALIMMRFVWNLPVSLNNHYLVVALALDGHTTREIPNISGMQLWNKTSRKWLSTRWLLQQPVIVTRVHKLGAIYIYTYRPDCSRGLTQTFSFGTENSPWCWSSECFVFLSVGIVWVPASTFMDITSLRKGLQRFWLLRRDCHHALTLTYVPKFTLVAKLFLICDVSCQACVLYIILCS